jgi:exodeoxyribonuclease VII small subunit
MKKETGTEQKNVKFEEALKRLEKIVEKLEAGDVPLEESLSLYEEGISLFKHCSSKLEEARKKVEILTREETGGKLKAEPFSMGRTNHDRDEIAGKAGESDEEIPF